MQAMKELAAHLETRPTELKRLREEGVKIVGYVPTGYTPEELIRACGAVPVGLIRGGDAEAVARSAAYVPRWLDTFCRSQIGYRMAQDEPLYKLIDMLVVSITDSNIRAIADSFSYYTDVDVFRHGVSRVQDKLGLEYYKQGLNLLKDKLEQISKLK